MAIYLCVGILCRLDGTRRHGGIRRGHVERLDCNPGVRSSEIRWAGFPAWHSMGIVFYRCRRWGAVASELLVVVSCAVMLDERVRMRIRAEATEEAYGRGVSQR